MKRITSSPHVRYIDPDVLPYLGEEFDLIEMARWLRYYQKQAAGPVEDYEPGPFGRIYSQADMRRLMLQLAKELYRRSVAFEAKHGYLVDVA